jgi:thioredoxin 1
VNVDDCPELAARFGITSIPAVFLFKGGQIAAQSVGYMSKDELAAKLLK